MEMSMSWLVLACCLIIAKCTVNVDTEEGFRNALLGSDPDVLLTASVALSPPFWEPYLPIVISRNVTVRGPNVSFAQMTTALDLGYVKGKARLLPNVALTVELVVLSGAQAQPSEHCWSSEWIDLGFHHARVQIHEWTNTCLQRALKWGHPPGLGYFTRGSVISVMES